MRVWRRCAPSVEICRIGRTSYPGSMGCTSCTRLPELGHLKGKQQIFCIDIEAQGLVTDPCHAQKKALAKAGAGDKCVVTGSAPPVTTHGTSASHAGSSATATALRVRSRWRRSRHCPGGMRKMTQNHAITLRNSAPSSRHGPGRCLNSICRCSKALADVKTILMASMARIEIRFGLLQPERELDR